MLALQIVSQPQEPQEDQEYYMQRVRRRAEHVQPAFVPSFFKLSFSEYSNFEGKPNKNY